MEIKEEKREIFLTLKALESEPCEEDTDDAILATKIVSAIKRGGHLRKINGKIWGCHKCGSSEEFMRNNHMENNNQNPKKSSRMQLAI